MMEIFNLKKEMSDTRHLVSYQNRFLHPREYTRLRLGNQADFVYLEIELSNLGATAKEYGLHIMSIRVAKGGKGKAIVFPIGSGFKSCKQRNLAAANCEKHEPIRF